MSRANNIRRRYGVEVTHAILPHDPSTKKAPSNTYIR